MLVAPLALRPGRAALDSLPALARALDGAGPLLLPHADGSPPPPACRQAHGVPDDAAVAIGTSGSTGPSKLAVLTASSLRASAKATHDVLGGPGIWLLALPPHHIAGLQVLLRSLVSGHAPVAVERRRSFAPHHLASAVVEARDRAPGVRVYASLVPAQLVRMLGAPEGITALRRLDGVLVGGAATSREALERARAHGVPVVTTYGMSETCGGSVYDGRPLTGVRIRLENGRVHLGGAPVAHGYLMQERLVHGGVFTTDTDGIRWFRTDDLGHMVADGAHDGHTRLVIDGRVDDVIITGGLKVLPRDVERALEPLLPDGASVAVLGVSDPEWGQSVSAVFAARASEHPAAAVADLEARIPAIVESARRALPPHAIPRRIRAVAAFPLRGPGKPDQQALRRILEHSPAPAMTARTGRRRTSVKE